MLFASSKKLRMSSRNGMRKVSMVRLSPKLSVADDLAFVVVEQFHDAAEIRGGVIIFMVTIGSTTDLTSFSSGKRAGE